MFVIVRVPTLCVGGGRGDTGSEVPRTVLDRVSSLPTGHWQVTQPVASVSHLSKSDPHSCSGTVRTAPSTTQLPYRQHLVSWNHYHLHLTDCHP